MKAILACLLLCALTAGAQPAQIIILRHGEKPDDPAAVHLSPRGRERAAALVSLLGRNSRFTSNAPVAALFATRVTRHDRGERTGETLAAVGRDLGLPIDRTYDSDSGALLAASVLRNPAYRGKTVIVCWTHHRLAGLAGAFGVSPPPGPWKDQTFDRLWILRLHDGRVEWSDVPQRLLPGDSKR
jgi:hypothetical protein